MTPINVHQEYDVPGCPFTQRVLWVGQERVMLKQFHRTGDGDDGDGEWDVTIEHMQAKITAGEWVLMPEKETDEQMED